MTDATLVAKADKYAQVAPAPREFSVTTGGRYRVTLSDVGFPGPLMSLDLIVTRGTQTIARLPQVGTLDFDATPGTYTVHVLGNGAGAGTASVIVAAVAGGTALLQYQVGIISNPTAPATNRSTLAAKFSVQTVGSYQLTLTDRRFPAALTSLDVLVVDASGVPVARVCQPALPSVCSGATLAFTANVGDYDLFVNAVAAIPPQAGLYSINVAGGPANTVLYAATHPVGTLEPHASFNFPAMGAYALTLTDLQFPAPLASVSGVIAQGSDLLATVNGATTQAFNAAQGPATLYTTASPATAQGVGSFGVYVPNGVQTLYSDAKAVVSATANGARAYAIVGTFPNAGQYRIQATDFAFPATIPALQLLVTQDGTALGAVTAGGSLTVQAKAGQFMIVAVANLLSPTATGLFGVSIDSQAGASVLTIAQGVGDLFHTQAVTVGATGRLDVTLNDLGFPAQFQDLALVVTRGNTLVGQIFGGGKFTFAATPGDYSLNFVARNNATDNYGLYGVTVEDSPPEPTLVFSASAGSVPTQGSTTVSWTTTGANSCMASGGWTGTRATSGTNVAVGPFASDTTLTLTCTGVGGSKASDVKITIAAANQDSASGGGSFAPWQLLAFLSLLSLRGVVRRFRLPHRMRSFAR
jgi:hypothetical protein